jgi:hypothetical protein
VEARCAKSALSVTNMDSEECLSVTGVVSQPSLKANCQGLVQPKVGTNPIKLTANNCTPDEGQYLKYAPDVTQGVAHPSLVQTVTDDLIEDPLVEARCAKIALTVNSNSDSKIPSNSSRVTRMKEARRMLAFKRKRECCRPATDDQLDNLVSSRSVQNRLVQDRSRRMVLIGSDVVGLYPCMVGKKAGEECYQSVMESDIIWDGINYKEGVRYINSCQ